MTQKQRTSILMALLPLLIAVIIMIPRLRSPQFGLLDDFSMLSNARNILQGDWSMSHDLQAGRFRPVYWLYYTVIYAAAGSRPFWFFFAQMTLLFILVLEIRALMKMFGANDVQILIASLVFVLSMPVIENFYTLSKGEPLQLVFLLASLLCFEKITSSQSNSRKFLFTTLAFFSVLSAMLVKETAIIMIPIVGLWLGYALLFQKRTPSQNRLALLLFLGAVTLAVAAYFGLRSVWGTATISGGTYTKRYDLNVQDMIPRVLRWATMYAFYFHYLLPLAILSFVTIAANKVKDQQQRLFNWAVWVVLWMAVLLPWEYAEVYYLLPFGLGIAVLVGFLSPSIFALLKSAKPAIRRVSIPLVALVLLLFLATLPNFFTHGRMQLAFDRANTMMLESVAQIVPQNGDLFNGLDSKNEYERMIQKYFQDFAGRSDISYAFIENEVFENLPRSSKGIVILPFIKNQPNLTVRAGTEERYSMEHRRVIFQKMDYNLIPIAEFIENFRIFNINFPVLLCPLLNRAGFCEIPDPVIDLNIFSYGWEVYQIP